MEIIKQWFKSGADYETGVQIYLKYGKEPAMLNLFREEHSPFKEQCLKQALKELYHSTAQKSTIAPPAIPLQPTGNTQAQKIVERPGGWPDQLDPYLSELHNKWQEKYGEMKSLEQRIYDVSAAGDKNVEKRNEAGVMAHRILDLDEQCDEIYQQRDYYLATGKVSAITDDVVDASRWPLMLENAKRNLRRNRGKLEKSPHSKRLEELVYHWQSEVIKLKKLLKIEDGEE